MHRSPACKLARLACAALLLTAPASAQLDATWTVTANGQTVPVAADGSFRIPNVSAADQFGPAGPGSAPDFVSDDPVQITGVSTVDGVARYLYSQPFLINSGATAIATDLVITDTPPPLPQKLELQLMGSLLEVGASEQAVVLATLGDASVLDVSGSSSWTTYSTSNPAIAAVDRDGFVTGVGAGSAFITAKNGGAISVRLLQVIEPNAPTTTVVGFVELPDGTPVGGASTRVFLQGQETLTDSEGYFLIPDVVTTVGSIAVVASAAVDGQPLTGSSGSLSPVPDGFTDVGLIRLEPATSSGRDFLLSFPRNHNGSASQSIFVASEKPTLGSLSVPALGFLQPFSVTPGEVTTIPMPPGSEVFSSETVGDRTVVISTENNVCVYGLNQQQFTTDAYAALPVTSFGTEYRVLSYNASNAFISLLAPDSDTRVTITPTTSIGIHPAGVPYEVQMEAGQVYYLAASGDVSGALIESSRPIGVLAGAGCVNIPNGFTACDHIVEMFPPLSAWGNEVFSMDLRDRTGPDTFRVLAAEADTQVEVFGADSTQFTLGAGEFQELLLDGANRIAADKPILVCQYSNGQSFDGSTGDPFMMLVPPREQYQTEYTFSTPPTGFAANYANVVAHNDDITTDNVLLDGSPIAASEFVAVPGSDYSAAQIPLEGGAHVIAARSPLGLSVYGFNNFDSYGYPGGMAIGILGER